MIVERIEPISNQKIGDIIYPRSLEMNGRKRHVEQIFEEIRKEMFPHLPSRLSSVYVYPKSEHDYKSLWLYYKYSHNIANYNLIEAEAEYVYWFDASYYNQILPTTPDALIHEYAVKYWSSHMKEEKFTYNMDIEGLCSHVIIKSCKQEHYPGKI